MRVYSSYGSGLHLAIRLKVFRFLFFSADSARRFEISSPTQLILYDRLMQLIISMKIKQIAYLYVVAAKSPKPTVSITVVPQ
jgi:hypothetical protein